MTMCYFQYNLVQTHKLECLGLFERHLQYLQLQKEILYSGTKKSPRTNSEIAINLKAKNML